MNSTDALTPESDPTLRVRVRRTDHASRTTFEVRRFPAMTVLDVNARMASAWSAVKISFAA